MNVSRNFIKTYPMYYKRTRYILNKKLYRLSFSKNVYRMSEVAQKKSHQTSSFIDKHLYSGYNVSEYNADQEESTDLHPYFNNQTELSQDIVWYTLFARENDPKILELIKCASINEVFSFVKDNLDSLNDKHLTQIILVINNLQNMFFYHLDDETARRDDFFKKLLEYQEFHAILTNVENRLSTYNPLFLSYTVLYLHKLGLPVENHLVQDIGIRLCNHLLEDFSLEIVANLFKVIFNENSVRPYYIVNDVIPIILKQIDTIETARDLENLVMCVFKMSHIVTYDILNSLQEKIKDFINKKKLTSNDYRTILKIFLLYNYPRWRNQYCHLMAECVMLLEDSMNLLNFTELELVYDVLFSNQEPGEALNTIQRCAAKFLQHLEDSQTHRVIRLKLFACLIFFSSPTNIIQFRRDIHKYLSEDENLETLIVLRKIFSYLKITDYKLCDFYWSKACHVLKEIKEIDGVVKLMENYFHFSSNHSRYRHYAFEYLIIRLAEKYFQEGTLTLIPQRFYMCLSFALVYCNDRWFLNNLMNSFRENYKQLSVTSCLKLSQALHLLKTMKNSAVTEEDKQEIKLLLNKASENIYEYENRSTSNNILVKAAILRQDYDNDLINEILCSTRDYAYLSSKLIESICFNLYSTDSLIPETMNKCTEYVVHNKKHVIGFNVEKILYLCYYLNYYPINPDNFFDVVTDIIIRDQERSSGISFLQSALALSYFNRLPKSLVKQIFNVEFLDKLDIELLNCYSKDKYPHRVRYVLMQLNRAVCLEYPEYNVPWFHQRYIEAYQRSVKFDAIDDAADQPKKQIREYLKDVVEKQYIQENVRVPYGYKIDFVIHMDQNNCPTMNFDDPSTVKLGIIIKYPHSYTRQCIQLKGLDELKNRHLEILGYKMNVLKWSEFRNLLYGSERNEFIKKTVFS